MIDKAIINELFDNNSKFVIYGAGDRGTKLVHILRKLNIEVICMIDRDEKKEGLTIDGTFVYSIKHLEQIKPSEKIIVSMFDGEAAFEKLNESYNVMPLVTANYILRLSYLNCEDYGYDDIETIDHFYNPYPTVNDKCTLFPIVDVDLNNQKQRVIFDKVIKNYRILENNKKTTRYSTDNTAYGIVDALVLYSMICEIKPQRIVEIGSGFSSAVMLDTNEYKFGNNIKLEFIEPYPARLNALLKDSDSIMLQECKLQDAKLDSIKKLNSGDILFIDSSHMGKKGSDVNMIYFKILPLLRKGVYIHIHDVFKEFEYPAEWTRKGWAWNEDYLVRAFLMNNSDYEILFFTDMWTEEFQAHNLNGGGGSLWIRKK